MSFLDTRMEEVLEVAVSTEDTQQGDDDDAQDDDSYCYESDYEYEAEMMDGSDDDDYFDASEQNIHQEHTEPSSPKNPDMVVEDDNNPEGFSRSVDSMPTPSYVPPVAALHTTVSIDNESLAFCRLCRNEEGHIPVVDCSLVEEWNRLIRDGGNGILDVDPQLMFYAMRHRVEECYTYLHTTLRRADRWPIPTGNFNPPTIDHTVRLRLPQTEEQPENRGNRRTAAERHRRRLEIPRRCVRARSQSPHRRPERMLGTTEDFHDLSPNASPRRRRSPEARPVSAIIPERADLFFAHKTRESVAADLRAHRWDVQAWRNAMRRRRDLEQDLAVLPAARRTLENQRREQLRIEREIVHLGLDSMVILTPEHESDTTTAPEPPVRRIYEESRQQILEDHHNFLERTMPVNVGTTAAPEQTPTPGWLGMISNLVSGTTPTDPNASHAFVNAATANSLTETRNDLPSATVALPQMYTGTAMNNDASWTCPICLDDDVEPEDRLCVRFPYRGLGLEHNFCGHFYCRECWTHYIQTWLEDVRGAGGRSLTTRLYCPDPQCYALVTRDHVQRVVRGTESQENSDMLFPHPLVRLHDDLALNSFVEGNRGTICWCPGPNCNRIMVRCGAGVFVPSTGRQPDAVGYGFFTSCGTCEFNFCFRCGNTRENHHHQVDGLRCPEVIPLNDEIVRLAGGGNAVPVVEPNDMLLAHRNNIAAAAAVDNTVPAVERNDMMLAHRNNIAAAAAPNLDLVLDRPRIREYRDYDDVNTNKIRPCPSCKIPIEKNGGCAHMRCKCGHHFCWLCMSDMNNNMGHFCGREGAGDILLNNMRDRRIGEANPLVFNLARIDLNYLIEQLREYVQGNSNLGTEINSSCNELLSQQRDLYRFAHYYNRFIFHHQGQQFSESQCDCVAKRALKYTHFSAIKSAADTDFFQVANERLVTARRILKYSYCLLYFKLKVTAPLNDTTASRSEISEGHGCPNDNALSASLPVQLAIFMDNQERLERLTEQLSFMSENATTPSDRQRVMDMIQTVDKCLQAVTELSFKQDI